jgi:hypothetical protein
VKAFVKSIFFAFLLFLSTTTANSFEIDNLKSGMTFQEAKQTLEKYSYHIKEREDFIEAWQNKNREDTIFLNFCKGQLIQVQKHLTPKFEHFTQLVDKKRQELGRPVDAYSRPTNIESNFKKVQDSVTFLWKSENNFVQVEYTQFTQNNQLSITYSIYNECYEIPY